ncbi:TBC1 domain family member 1 [Chelonia mydas]|uniref:TBC1 domain family member 1 n=1 Tax=Chelonia mydas TaxID=8469 RepID=M7BUY3_CHEMY|nr:TBC1 domain family member 1 [Chelonia mydas]
MPVPQVSGQRSRGKLPLGSPQSPPAQRRSWSGDRSRPRLLTSNRLGCSPRASPSTPARLSGWVPSKWGSRHRSTLRHNYRCDRERNCRRSPSHRGYHSHSRHRRHCRSQSDSCSRSPPRHRPAARDVDRRHRTVEGLCVGADCGAAAVSDTARLHWGCGPVDSRPGELGPLCQVGSACGRLPTFQEDSEQVRDSERANGLGLEIPCDNGQDYSELGDLPPRSPLEPVCEDGPFGPVKEDRKRTTRELRELWQKAILQQILLLRMEKENQKLQAIKSRTSCSVHAGALLRFWDSMITSADEICTVTCADQLAMLAKQEMKFKSLRGFSCLPCQFICVESAVQSGHNGALWDSSRRPIPSNCIHTIPNSTRRCGFKC